jgi:glucose-1-phosphatase
MKAKTIKAAFFDLGNVLVKFDMEILVKGFSSYTKIKNPNFSEYVMNSPNTDKYMEGKLSSSKFYSRTKKLFKMDISYGDFYRVWNEIFTPYPEVEEIVKKIKTKYPELRLILVSNTNETHYNFLEKEYEVLALFDETILSHEVGCQKPDPDIFTKALLASGTIPKDTFYTDDRLDLIESARTMGIRAYHFTGHEKLISDLAKVNIFV